jgi:hypothetical protein
VLVGPVPMSEPLRIWIGFPRNLVYNHHVNHKLAISKIHIGSTPKSSTTAAATTAAVASTTTAGKSTTNTAKTTTAKKTTTKKTTTPKPTKCVPPNFNVTQIKFIALVSLIFIKLCLAGIQMLRGTTQTTGRCTQRIQELQICYRNS